MAMRPDDPPARQMTWLATAAGPRPVAAVEAEAEQPPGPQDGAGILSQMEAEAEDSHSSGSRADAISGGNDTTADIAAGMTDAEAQEAIDKWLRLSADMGVWAFSGDDWIARRCQTEVGPLAGPPVQLRVATVAHPGGNRYVGEVRQEGIHPRSSGPGDVLLILHNRDDGPVAGWDTIEEVREALEALLLGRHDPELVRLCNYDVWARA